MEELRHRSAPLPDRATGFSRLLNGTLGFAAVALLLLLVLITCIDVVGRYFLNAPLAGAFEMTELMLAALVFTALPMTTERREHVEVDLLALGLGPLGKRLLRVFAGLFGCALLLTFAWRLAAHAAKAGADHAVTNALAIPLAPFGYLAALSCVVSAGIALWKGFQREPEA